MSMVPILMMSAKLATLDPVKIKIFLIKVYDLIIYALCVTNKVLSHVSNDIVNAVV